MDTPSRETSIAELLRDVLVRTEAAEFAEALAILEIARAAESNNIYLGALKRQLETMFSLQRNGELGAEKKIELMESVPGIIECAAREHTRQPRTAVTGLHHGERPAPPVSDQEAGKELEALKLLYFQRASKFVMKGEYEQALAEVERVFVVDPQNTIAKQYAQRVGQLIEQARKLASAPEASPQEPTVALAYDSEPVSTGRSTAWTDEFLAPPVSIPEHRTAATSSKQTIAYGTSLAASLTTPVVTPSPASTPTRRRSNRLLAVIVAVLLMGGGTFAILTATGTEVGRTQAVPARQPAQMEINGQNTGTVGLAQAVNETALPQHPPESGVQQTEAVSAASRSEQPKPPSISAAREPLQQARPESGQIQGRRGEATVTESLNKPAAAPVPEPEPAVTEPTPAETPAFVAIEKQPEIISLEKPQFSPFVWKTGVEAQVVLRVLIDTDGNPVDTQILKSTSSVFEGPVIEAVMKSKFSPAQMGQGPVSAWLTIPFKMKQPK